MKLAYLKIKNFRCYEDEIELSIDDLTCIIGQNDVGKSTIIEALNAFFNDAIDFFKILDDEKASTDYGEIVQIWPKE